MSDNIELRRLGENLLEQYVFTDSNPNFNFRKSYLIRHVEDTWSVYNRHNDLLYTFPYTEASLSIIYEMIKDGSIYNHKNYDKYACSMSSWLEARQPMIYHKQTFRLKGKSIVDLMIMYPKLSGTRLIENVKLEGGTVDSAGIIH